MGKIAMKEKRTELIVGGILLTGIAALFIFKPSPTSRVVDGNMAKGTENFTARAPKPVLSAGLTLAGQGPSERRISKEPEPHKHSESGPTFVQSVISLPKSEFPEETEPINLPDVVSETAETAETAETEGGDAPEEPLKKQKSLVEPKSLQDPALTLIETIESPIGKIRVLCNLAGTLSDAGDTDRAVKILGQAKEMIENLETDSDRAFAHTHLIGALVKTGQSDDAKATLKAVLEAVNTIKGVDEKIAVLASITSALKGVGDTDQTKQVLAQSLVLARQIQAQAQAVLKQSLTLADQITDSSEKIDALKTIAAAMAQPGNLEHVEEVFVQALILATEIPDPEKKAAALEDIASSFTRSEPGVAFAQLQFDIGWMYYEGKSLPRNVELAARWYRKAADHGYPQAQVNLGIMYNEGEGVAENNAEALKLFMLAAEKGHSDGQTALGMMLALGKTGEPDFVQATKWFALAANSGDVSAKQAQAELVKKMNPSQIAEGQKLAEAWVAARKEKK